MSNANNVETERSFSFFLNFVRLFFTSLVWAEFIALALYSCRRPGLALHTRMSGGIEGLKSQVNNHRAQDERKEYCSFDILLTFCISHNPIL